MSRPLTNEEKEKIVALLSYGVPTANIAEIVGRSKSVIDRIASGKYEEELARKREKQRISAEEKKRRAEEKQAVKNAQIIREVEEKEQRDIDELVLEKSKTDGLIADRMNECIENLTAIRDVITELVQNVEDIYHLTVNR